MMVDWRNIQYCGLGFINYLSRLFPPASRLITVDKGLSLGWGISGKGRGWQLLAGRAESARKGLRARYVPYLADEALPVDYTYGYSRASASAIRTSASEIGAENGLWSSRFLREGRRPPLCFGDLLASQTPLHLLEPFRRVRLTLRCGEQ